MDKQQREVIKDRLLELCEQNAGRLTPELTVQDATNRDSPLHPLFEWDDDVAAHQFRLDQARALIRSVKIVTQVEDRKLIVPFYVHDPEAEGEQGYVPLMGLKTKEMAAREATLREFNFAEAALKRARDIAEVLNVHGDVQEIIDDILELRSRLTEEE